MMIILTGASGFVGRQLIPRLVEGGAQVTLAGRDPARLRTLFPGLKSVAYEELPTLKADLLVHLAVRNNDRDGTLEEFRSVNVQFLREIVENAIAAGIPRLINLSSTHALEPATTDPYAISKREAAQLLEQEERIEGHTIYLPAVYGEQRAGNLSRIDDLPHWARKPAFTVLSALKPTVHVDRIAHHILAGGGGGILTDGQENNPVYNSFRLVMDWGFALFVVLFLWWLLLLIWALVAVTSPGPGLFVQTRVGKDGRLFSLYKFRTMAQGTKQAGSHEVSAASVTPMGHFLRRTKLDELPQVVNIMKGELSLIGPRPCLPVQEKLVEERRERGVLAILPGISGLAQVDGIDMSNPVRLAKRDADYIALRGLLLDLKIALRTAGGGGRGDRVGD